jgi:hypothetical protein
MDDYEFFEKSIWSRRDIKGRYRQNGSKSAAKNFGDEIHP